MQQSKKVQVENNDQFFSPQEKKIQIKEENFPTVQPVNNKLSHKKKNSLFNFTPDTALEKGKK
jgi:hypothetical protein